MLELFSSLHIVTYFTFFLIPATAENYILPDYIIPKNYNISLHIDPHIDSFNGTVIIAFVTNNTTNELLLHANPDISITNISFKDENCTVVESNNITEIVNISCAVNFSTRYENIISIDYDGYYSDDYRGIFKEKADKDLIILTHFQPTFARRVFPCLDEPRYKATFDVTIYHPSSYTAVGNNVVVENENIDSSNETKTTFETTPVMPTYSLAFLVSKFVMVSKGLSSIYIRPSEENSTKVAKEYSETVLETIGEWTNISYTELGMKRIGHIAVPLFPVGAMENWGLCTYREVSIIDPVDKLNFSTNQTIISMLAHEISHQWFGNLVTLDWWSNIWLNEGFARYFEYLILIILGEKNINIQQRFIIDELQPVLYTDSLPSDPLSSNFDDVQTQVIIYEKFDTIAYQKGAAILRMIEAVLGRANFQKGLQIYLKSNQYKNTNPQLLLESLQSVYNSSSYSLSELLDTFIYTSGYPLLTVRLGNNTVELGQEPFSIVSDQNEVNSTWYLPLSWTTSKEKNFEVQVKNWLEPGRGLEIEVEEDDWILFNIHQIGYYRVNYDDALWERLIATLNGPNVNSIDVPSRVILIDDIFNIARTGRTSYENAFRLAEFLKNETEHDPWISFCNSIASMMRQLSDAETLDLLKNVTAMWINSAFPELKIKGPTVFDLKHIIPSMWQCNKDLECLKQINHAYIGYQSLPRLASYVFTEIIPISKQDKLFVYETILDGGSSKVDLMLDYVEKNGDKIHKEQKGFFTLRKLYSLMSHRIANNGQLNKLSKIADLYEELIGDDLKERAIKIAEVNIIWASTYNDEIKRVLRKWTEEGNET